MEKNNGKTTEGTPEDLFSLSDYFKVCIYKWKWFLVSVVIVCGIGTLYMLRQQPKYERTMSILIKDQDSGGGASGIAGAFSSLGLVSSNTNVNNELISILSPAVIMDVVDRLGLQVNIVEKGLFHGTTLYGPDAPFIVTFPDLGVQEGASFKMDMNPDGTARLYKFRKSTVEGKERFPGEVKVNAGFATVKTPVGRVCFTPNPIYAGTAAKESTTYFINRMGLQATTEFYLKQITGDLTDKEAEVIDLTIKDVSVARAVDILNSIIEVYNQIYINDKNKVAAATSGFIDDRLRFIEQELGVVDSDISEYKSKTLVPDLEMAAKINMETTRELSSQELEYSNQLAMARYVKEYVMNPANANNVIPVNTGMGSNQLETQIGTYNNMLLMRNNLKASSSASNPLVEDYDTQLTGMREAIVRAITAQVTNLEKTLGNIAGAKGNIQGKLASGPAQAKYLLSVERQQKVKEELYLYLLQKREENELTQKFTADNTRIITPPYGSLKPVSPKKVMILCGSFLIGLLIPGLILYIQESGNSKVRSRKDLDRMNTPLVGEVPQIGRHKRSFLPRFLRKKNSDKLENALVVVKSGSRDVASEAFRIVRGNIDLMHKQEEDANVIMITSFNAGSGKSFVTFNLGASFALKGKRVLIVDCDLRHGSTSQFVGMPRKGLSDYLRGSTDDWRKMVTEVGHQEDLYVMPIGHRPPNPSELLDNGRIGTFLKEAAKEYDYVLVDCPPVDVVVDTQIVSQYVGRTIFVVRAGLFEKAAVAEIDNLYQSGKLRNMSIVLNGTERGFGGSYYGSFYGGSGYYYGSK